MTGTVTRAPAPRRPRRAAGTGVIAIIAAAVLVYGVVVALYAVGFQNASVTGCDTAVPSNAVVIAIEPQSVDAASDRLVANFSVLSFGPLAQNGSELLTHPLTIVVSDNDGPRTFTIAADSIPSPQPLKLITNGYVEQWPFDSHTVDVAFVSLQTIDGVTTALNTFVCGSAHVPGWNFTSAEVPGTSEVVIDGQPVTQLRITATRSSATIAFGLVILALMIVLPTVSLTVAILAYRGRRKVEATLMSWMAAMLFATIPLRAFLPGAPPIGSWIDYLVILWVLAGLVLGLVIYVFAWIRWTPNATAPARSDAAVAAAVAAADGGDAGRV